MISTAIRPIQKRGISLLILFFIASSSVLYAQKVNLEGRLQDSTGQAVVYANVIATPKTEEGEITFSISNEKGQYQLQLTQGVWYTIEITSLGFSPLIDSIRITDHTVKNYLLHRSATALEAAVVKAKMAMIVKEDTITYRVDQFRHGDERKLRGILKKLPGVEVDREGNVTVNGKKVSKLLVDGKPFFGGDVKLGVNNIPADAVEEVVALDDYHEVAFMKGLSDSDRMAMNIKLKEDKKDFVFGESEIGGGHKERYYLHPTLFYYSPKTTINFIGSLNNVNKSPLDWDDVLRFKGGAMAFMDNPIRSGNSGLSKFSGSDAVLHNKTLFGAANLSQQINKAIRLTAYTILAQQETESKITNHTEYLTQNNLIENRLTTSNHKGFSNFNKIRLRYTPDIRKDLAYDVVANVSNGTLGRFIRSRFADSTNYTHTLRDPHHLEISQYFRYNTRPTYEHTSEIRAQYTYKEARSLTHWNFDRPVFADRIPAVQDGETYQFLHHYDAITSTGRFNFKHYWVLNSTNHLYPKVGLYFFHETYNSTDYQRLQNGAINGFASAGFDNALGFQLIDPYIGFQYKFMLGKVVFKPGLVYHHYLWQIDQFDQRITDATKGVLAPELEIKFEPTTAKELSFNYRLETSFPEASSFANRLRLTGFNTLYRGNENLENALYHRLSLQFRNYDLAHGIIYRLHASYKRQEKDIQHTTILEGISQINTSIYSDLPEDSYRFRGNFTKRWRHYRASLSGQVYFNKYSRFINHQRRDYHATLYAFAPRVWSNFEDLPNFTLGARQIFRRSGSTQFENQYWSFSPYIHLNYYFLNGFIFKAQYNYNYTKDETADRAQSFQIGSASLYYRKEGSAWGFEIRVDNIFDVKYKRTHYFNEFMVYDRRTYIQPRTILFILSYQL